MSKPKTPAIERFFRQIVVKDGGCWQWIGAVKENHYGLIGLNDEDGKRSVYVHRFSYEYFIEKIPDGKEIDHLCRNRACCNPYHLEPVTRRENLRRSPITFAGINAAKTHCHNGHEFTDANTWIEKGKGRHCRRCHADNEERRRQRLRAERSQVRSC